MPGYLITTAATVNCAHGGQASATNPNPRVKADGQPTVQQPAPWTVAGCSLVPPAPGPDLSALWTTGSTRVKAGGLPLLLADSQASGVPSGNPALVVATQTRVKAI